MYCERVTCCSMRAETRRQSLAPVPLSWEHMHWETIFFASLHMSANDHKSTRSIDLGVTNKFWQIGRFVNIESAKN